MTTTRTAKLALSAFLILFGVAVALVFATADADITVWAVLAGGAITGMGVIEAVAAFRTGGGRY